MTATPGTAIRVLLVEDNPGDARLVSEMLREAGGGYVLTHVETLSAAIDRLSAHVDSTDVILLDLSLPDESGLDTLRRVLALPHRAGVVVMTGLGDDDVGVAATEAGARDYLVKGQVDFRTLRRALKLAMARQVREGQLESQSLTDELTGLNNRRGFLVHAAQYLKLARRNRQPIVLLFVDLDRFKHINDTFGHAVGDRALVETAAVLTRSLRESDIKARIGGDEFVALAINASEHGVAPLRARFEQALADINGQQKLPCELTFSVGIFRCPAEKDLTIEMLLTRADELMYAEKRTKQR
jgi:diguanylate cyclase (GGDEF)-like protein